MARNPTMPGEILLEEFLAPMGISQAALAKHIAVDYKVINRMVNGHSSLTPDIAVRFSKALGTSSEFWLNLQQNGNPWNLHQVLRNVR